MRWGICCTANRKGGTSTPAMATIVICRSTVLSGTFRCGRKCAPASTGRMPASCRPWKRWWRPSGSAAARRGSSCAVYYCLGLAKNSVLIEQLGPALAGARARHCLTGASVRVFAEFAYETRKTWSRPRRIIGKAEVSRLGDNPRFLATNLPARGFPGEDRARFTPARLYEGFYCARGQMENMLKQQTLDLQADRMSTHYLASNQLRLWLATFAYLLMERLRALGLAGTDLAHATAGSVRLKLLKVAAQVRVSVRRVYVQLNSAYPWQEMFRLCQRRLQALGRASG